MKKALLFTSMFALALFTGCGGDSGDDEDRNVSGTWSGAITRVSDTCNSGAPQTANFTHTVTQNGEAVTLLDQNATRYLGNLLSDDGFSADATVNTTSGSTSCTEERQVEYDSINDDDDEAASMEVRIERTCGSTKCEISYTGTAARRVAGGGATPTPQPSGTPGVVTGGCAAINPRPAAGTYSGNGGCGLSDVKYTVSGQSVILEPFGANAATSFAINTANTSSATSTRNDLTINGVTGYSCSLTCAAPSTFTVSCFKEGGTTCTEKF